MNIQQLKVFTEITRSQSLSGAAEKLCLKQPTVSFHLKKLEEELGVELFRKRLHHIHLTDAGAALLPYARRITALTEEAEVLMKEHRELGRGKLRVGASYTPATYFLPPMLGAFQASFPQVLTLLTVKKADAILKLLREYEVDVVVVSLRDIPLDGLNVIPLVQDELKLIMLPDHRLAKKQVLEIDDLRGEAFLVHEPGSTSRELSDAWARDVGLHLDIRMELGAIETIKESIKYNMGIGILPFRSVQREIDLGELTMHDLPEDENKRHICLVYRQEDNLSYQVRTFIEFIKKKAGEVGTT